MGQVRVVVSDEATNDLFTIALLIAAEYGSAPGRRFTARLRAEIDGLGSMPTRHMPDRELRDRALDYRRALTGKHRVIFTLSPEQDEVVVVRVDLQSSNPAPLDDLP